MRKHYRKVLLRVLVSAAAVSLALLLAETPDVRAAKGGIPGPPPVPPGPCISTGLLVNSAFVICSVRNVGVIAHNITIDFRDDVNFSIQGRGQFGGSLGPGQSFTPDASTSGDQTVSCVVTTDEGTTEALADLSVTLLYGGGSHNGDPIAETAGQIFKQCAPSNGPEPPAPAP